MRTMNASTSTPNAKPKPIGRIIVELAKMKPPNTEIIMIAAATTKRGFTQVRVELDGCPVQVRRLNVRHDLLQFGEGGAVTGRENDLAGAAVGTGEALGKLVGELLGACECGV